MSTENKKKTLNFLIKPSIHGFMKGLSEDYDMTMTCILTKLLLRLSDRLDNGEDFYKIINKPQKGKTND